MNSQSSNDDLEQLHDEIAAKRARLAAEIEELRRRKSDTMVNLRHTAKIMGAAALFALCAGSLINAFADIFRSEDLQETDHEHTITHTLAGLAWTAIKVLSLRYVQQQLRSRRPVAPTDGA